MALVHLGWAWAMAFLAGVCFYTALRLPERARQAALLVVLLPIALSPLLVPAHAKFLRLLGAVFALVIGVKLFDLHLGARQGFRPALATFLAYLPNPFALVLRKVTIEPRPPWPKDLAQLLAGAAAAVPITLLPVHIFRFDWRPCPFVVEHCAKAVPFFLEVLVVGNAAAAAWRLAGLPATDFSDNFFLSRTPAEFWRRYNRPVTQFFYYDVFKPLGGARRPVVGTLAAFGVSALIHEYLFDIATGRILGSQLAFFMLQGVAVAATLKFRPRGLLAAISILLTFAFNLAATILFLASMNAVVPFYARRGPSSDLTPANHPSTMAPDRGDDPMLRLSAFADEISPDLEEQIRVCKENGVTHFELRGVSGKNVMDFDAPLRSEVRSRLRDNSLGVIAIGSPIGKVKVSDPWPAHLEKFKRAVELADYFDAPFIRLFSYYPPEKRDDIRKYRDEVLRRMRAKIDYVRNHDVVLVHENEKDIYGERGRECLDLMESIQSPKLRSAFDFANFILSGERPIGNWPMLKPHTVHIHVKDAVISTGKIVPAGQGDGDIGPILKDAHDSGYRGFVSLEPHLGTAGQFGGFTGPALFKLAADALKDVCRRHSVPLAAT